MRVHHISKDQHVIGQLRRVLALGAMARYVAAHVKAANAVDRYTGTYLPRYTPGEHSPVTLPSRGPDGGWKAGTRAEWDEVFRFDRKTGQCGLKKELWLKLKRLHMDAHYATGEVTGNCQNVKDTIEMFLRNGLACTPWLKGRHFWGLKNSEKQAMARKKEMARENGQRSHDNWLERLLETLDEDPDANLSHTQSGYVEKAKAALREAAGRGVELPNTEQELRKLLGKMLEPSGVCPDCLVEMRLIFLEHAKDGPNKGRARSRDCKVCNTAGRSFTDVLIAIAHALAKTLTAEDHADVAELAVAYARPGQATRDAKKRLARARRMAAVATVVEDAAAVAYVSTTRLRAADDDADDTYEARRASAMAKEEARLAKRRQQREACERQALPPVSQGTRVVVIDEESRYCGRRGVVQGFRGHTHIAVLLGRDTSDRCFVRKQLRIETPRKPAAKPSAKKPSAKKPAKKKAKKAPKK